MFAKKCFLNMLELALEILHIVMRAMKKICIPAPRREARVLVCLGGLKTSPWTSFHPVSSKVSS